MQRRIEGFATRRTSMAESGQVNSVSASQGVKDIAEKYQLDADPSKWSAQDWKKLTEEEKKFVMELLKELFGEDPAQAPAAAPAPSPAPAASAPAPAPAASAPAPAPKSESGSADEECEECKDEKKDEKKNEKKDEKKDDKKEANTGDH
jgi:hypothetical protein